MLKEAAMSLSRDFAAFVANLKYDDLPPEVVDRAKGVLVALAAGYEVMERMAAEFIPTVMSRGFHAGPVFGIFGAAVAAAKLQRLDENRIHSAIAQCVNLAAGNLEGARSGGRSLREGGGRPQRSPRCRL